MSLEFGVKPGFINCSIVFFLSARLTLRRDDPADFDALVALNLSRFGERSYFADERFTRGFRDLLALAQERGWLRMTALLDRDEPVAADLGCVYQGVYTLLGGGTHGDYPGIAKVINLHHLERACEERFTQVDFLCGDFGWKTLFHLTPRPLYLIAGPGPARRDPGTAAQTEALAAGRPGLIHAR